MASTNQFNQNNCPLNPNFSPDSIRIYCTMYICGMKSILLSLLVLPLLTIGQTRVLFLGNSYTAVNDLPGLFDSISTNAGETVVTGSVTPGGFTFMQHTTNPASLSALNQAWDFVVLQEQSQRPSFSPTQVSNEVLPYAAQLDSMAALSDSCTKTVFYMTWGRKNGDAMNCPSYPPVCTFGGMQQRLRDSYLLMGNSNQAIIAPAGVAWQRSILTDSTLNLYDTDGSHPNLNGSYLTACVMYATIFKKDPALLTWNGNLLPATAAYLRGIASLVVLDSADQWNMNIYDVKANFGINDTAYTISLNDSSINATEYAWSFGDGNTDTLASPTHTYVNAGTYTIQLIASSPCDADTFSRVVVITDTTTVKRANEVNAELPVVYPNPGKDEIYVSNLPEHDCSEISIYNLQGKKVLSLRKSEAVQSVTIPVSGLPSGVYYIEAGGKKFSWRKE